VVDLSLPENPPLGATKKADVCPKVPVVQMHHGVFRKTVHVVVLEVLLIITVNISFISVNKYLNC
jgi:hypothetical protein